MAADATAVDGVTSLVAYDADLKDRNKIKVFVPQLNT